MNRTFCAVLIAVFALTGCSDIIVTTLPYTDPQHDMWCDPDGIIPTFMREGEC